MDKLDRKDLKRYQKADYRIIVKNTKGKIVGKSDTNKCFKESSMEFEQVNETESFITFKTSERVNRAVLQMREEGKKGWIVIADRIIPIMLLGKTDVLSLTWSLKITIEKKRVVMWKRI